ncbi:MAG: M1 family peptidase [Bacteroidetes bacterium]|nr:MAG: M1 family peptidase [Bacteroidota bacterium]
MKKWFQIFFVFVLAVVLSRVEASFAQDSKQYFQQEVNYKITVSLDDKKHEFSGDESIEYINNSSDELTFIWFHIWPNAYKNNKTALAKQLIADGNKKFYFASENDRGYISQLDFKVNGQAVKTEKHPEHIDIIKIILNEPLKSGGKITITTPFHVKIPIGVFSRLGHIGQQYQITQWYPKPAVYDRYGWHPMPYLNQGEFYSEFGSFDVSVTLPKNYVVGATGTLVNGEEETAWLMHKVEETKAIEKYKKNDTLTPASASEMKTLNYQASNVHDFAWFADKRYHVLHDVVELPHSKRKVDTWVMYTNMEGELWKKGAKYVSDAVYYYSLWNGDYPYPHATAVDGSLSAGGGMEYPMITVIGVGGAGSPENLDRVIAHEVGHNWFYGILGSNERDHAWMDEGVNSFNEQRYMAKKYPEDSTKAGMSVNIGGMKVDMGKLLGIPDLSEETFFDLGYRFNAVKKEDQPVDLTSGEYTQINYGTIVYGKTAVILTYLQAYLGVELYDKCAQVYFETWKFKHPYPEDIKKVYEEVSEKDLSWFFDELIPTRKQIDYKIYSVKPAKCVIADNAVTEWRVTVKNKGAINSPFNISTLVEEGKVVSTQWFDGFAGKNTVLINALYFDHLKIDAQNIMPDINRQNNTLKMHGLCKKTELFNLRMFGVVHNTDKTQLFWAPVMGWNYYNKFMLGAAIYNNLLPEKKFEYVLMPMYGFGNKDMAGGASIHYNIHPNKVFQTIRFGVNAERYCYGTTFLPNTNFNKIAPELILEIKKKHLNNPIKQTINIRQVNIFKELAIGDYGFAPVVYHYDTVNIAVNDITYKLDNARKINPYNIVANIQVDNYYLKTALTANYRITMKGKKKAVDLRGYLGHVAFPFSGSSNYFDGNWYLHASGGTGVQDYLYDNVFLGRSERDGVLSHQFAETDGGMKVYTPLGRSSDWLFAFNIKSPMPGKFPIKLFADISFMPVGAALNQTMIYDAGIYIPMIKDMVEIYCPILVSRDIKDVFYLNNTDLKDPTPDKNDPDKFRRMARMIRFTFNIHKLNPFELVRNLSL